MILTAISSASAMSPGAHLWVVGEPTNSSWCRKCDWYLNFQLSNALKTPPMKPNPEALRLFVEAGYDLQITDQIDGKKSILVSPYLRLPAQQLVYIPSEGHSEQWFKSILNIWRDLDRPSMRIFLPQNITAPICEEFFREVNEVVDISYVSDS